MKTKLLIIEGPDCSGKSTLSAYLARQYRAVRWHMTYTKSLTEGMFDYQMNALENAEWIIKNTDQVVIFDRHWPSEYIYGSLLRPHRVPFFDHSTLAAKIEKLGGCYVFCFRRDVVEAHQANLDPAHPYDEKLFRQIVKRYAEWADMMMNLRMEYNQEVKHIDPTDPGRSDFIRYNYDVYAHNMASFKMLLDKHV